MNIEKQSQNNHKTKVDLVKDGGLKLVDHVSIPYTMKHTASVIVRWVLVLGYASIILALSMQSSIPGHSRIPDKLGHAAEYMLFGFLMARALQTPGHVHLPRQLVLSWIICLVFAAFDELLQSHTPGRDASIADWAADFAGISLTHLLILWRSYKERSLACDEMS